MRKWQVQQMDTLQMLLLCHVPTQGGQKEQSLQCLAVAHFLAAHNLLLTDRDQFASMISARPRSEDAHLLHHV